MIESRSPYVIPVIFHVLRSDLDPYISDALIWDQVKALNRDFSGSNGDIAKVPADFKSVISTSGLQFCLASDLEDGPLSSIIRIATNKSRIGLSSSVYYDEEEGSDAIRPDRYLNIWIADTGDFISGFGTYPEIVDDQEQGVVIHPDYFGSDKSPLGRTLVHEVGHYLGLRHTWDGNADCQSDDGVDDTPLQVAPYIGCPPYPQNSCGSSDMFMNFMDYVSDNCMFMFTEGQMARMKVTLEMFRPGLKNYIQKSSLNTNSTYKIFNTLSPDFIVLKKLDNLSELVQIRIINNLGQILYSDKIIWSDEYYLEVNFLPAGVYYLTIENWVDKFIVSD